MAAGADPGETAPRVRRRGGPPEAGGPSAGTRFSCCRPHDRLRLLRPRRAASACRSGESGRGVPAAHRGRTARDRPRGVRAFRTSAVRVPEIQHAVAAADSRRVDFDGEERVRMAYGQGKGILFITGHFGFWELHAVAHPLRFEPIGVLARTLDNGRVNALLEEIRQRTGNVVIYRQGSIRKVMRMLSGKPRRRDPDRSAHHRRRRHVRRLLRASSRDDVGGRRAGAAHWRAGCARVRPAARTRTVSVDLRASGRAAGGRQRGRDSRIHAAVHGRTGDVRPSPS